MTYYDSNFGHWNIASDEDLDFYREVQSRSVEKQCADCGRTVRIMPQYDCCNSCADARENGWGY